MMKPMSDGWELTAKDHPGQRPAKEAIQPVIAPSLIRRRTGRDWSRSRTGDITLEDAMPGESEVHEKDEDDSEVKQQ